MIYRHPFLGLLGADHGWIKARLHFTPDKAFGPLMAWNDDEIAGKSGFPVHPHQNVEIVTYVRDGAITHQDDLGNKGRASAGEFQVMSAGIGIHHTETNEEAEPTRLFQIWLQTRSHDITPRWGTGKLPVENTGGFVPLASGNPRDIGALPINADARVLGARLKAGDTLNHSLAGSSGYLISTKAGITVNNVEIDPNDGCRIEKEQALTIKTLGDTELVFVEFV